MQDELRLDEPTTWDRLVQRDSRSALAVAARAIKESTGDSDVIALAYSASSRALLDLGLLDEARRASQSAISTVQGSHRPDLRSSIMLTSAAVLAESGSIDIGLQTLDELASASEGVGLARVWLQAVYVLHHAGRLNEALDHVERAERLLGKDAEPRDWIRLYSNRGLILLQQGRLDEAEIDLTTAESLATGQEMTAFVAQCQANLAVLHGRARRLGPSMRYFASAAAEYRRAGNPSRGVTSMEIDRAEVMLHSGLVLEAIDAARTAVGVAAPTGNRMLLGDGQVMLARAELMAGRLREAARTAEAAASTLADSARPDMVAHARSVAAQALLHRGGDDDAARRHLGATRQLADDLRSGGWHQQADELSIARIRLGHGHRLYRESGADLEHLRLGAWSAQRDLALTGWYAEAVSRRAADDRQGALDACLSGLELVDDIVAEAPTLAQRSAAMRLGNDLSQLTIELAVELGEGDTVLAAAEGTRARALHEELAEQRRHRPLTEAGATQLRRELAIRLGDRTLVEWVVVHQQVWAVVFDISGSRLVEVGDVRTITHARDRVIVWLDMAAAEPDAPSVRAMRAAAALDELLIAPLDLPGSAGVVMVPVGLLHGIPWSGLPSLRGRPFTLTPNAQVWLGADRRAAGPIHSVGLVVGPEVESAAVERGAIERSHPHAAVAGGGGATAATVRSMFGALDLVHVAAHGRFRSDHPLLSTLRLDDGEATLYESVPDRLRSRLVILSSCEGGAQGTADGSEVLGLSAVMLARGAAGVLAPLTVVRDLECADFVADVHAELAAGEPFACAVAEVRQRWLADDDLSRWAVASSFTCFGSGAVTLAGD